MGTAMATIRAFVRRDAWLAAAVAACGAAAADEVVVATSDAFAAPLEVAGPWFERRTGHRVTAVRGAAGDARADAVVAAGEALDALIAAGRVQRDGRRDLARSAAGEIVSAGIAAGAKSPAAARALVAFLASAELGPLVERHGLEQPGAAAAAWRPLFNGRDLTGWTAKIRGYGLGENFADTFRVRDGVLAVSYDGYETFAERFGHLFFAEPFSHYRLRIEYRFVGEQARDAPAWAVRNSGVMIHSQPPGTMLRDQDFPVSLEVQFLGGLSDGNARPTANVCTPGTRIVYDGAPDTSHCIRSTAPTIDGDAWVRADVLVQGGERIVHYVDGLPVIEYGQATYGGGNVDGYDPAAKPNGAPLERGYIALQSESHPIEFRRVELLELTGRVSD
jgi:hypothetical protein